MGGKSSKQKKNKKDGEESGEDSATNTTNPAQQTEASAPAEGVTAEAGESGEGAEPAAAQPEEAPAETPVHAEEGGAVEKDGGDAAPSEAPASAPAPDPAGEEEAPPQGTGGEGTAAAAEEPREDTSHAQEVSQPQAAAADADSASASADVQPEPQPQPQPEPEEPPTPVEETSAPAPPAEEPVEHLPPPGAEQAVEPPAQVQEEEVEEQQQQQTEEESAEDAGLPIAPVTVTVTESPPVADATAAEPSDTVETGAAESGAAAAGGKADEPSAPGQESVAGNNVKTMEFRWEEGGETVAVTGSFNDWKDKISLARIGEIFTVSVDLPYGEHLYKFIVDEQWVVSKSQPLKNDDSGQENNVITVA